MYIRIVSLINIQAIPRISSNEAHQIVKNVLINLPSLANGPTQRGDSVLEALFSAARNSIKSELAATSSTPSDIKSTISFLSLADLLVAPLGSKLPSASPGRALAQSSTKHSSFADPHNLLRGYIALLAPDTSGGSLSGSVLADRISSSAFQELLGFILKTIDLSHKSTGPSSNLKEQFIAIAFKALLVVSRIYHVFARLSIDSFSGSQQALIS